jgi:outer membrane protein OmpA-like peptidoglycan-associated protein
MIASHSAFGALQDNVSFVLMKQLRYPIAQTYMIDARLPLEYIQNQWKLGYHIAGISHGDNGYAVIMNGGMIPQKIISSDTFPSTQIRDYMALGFRMTAISAHAGKWDIIMSLQNGVYSQIITTHKQFPNAYIQEYWDKGYRIACIEYGNGLWTLAMNRAMFTQSQSYVTTDSIPKSITSLMKGLTIRSCKNIQGKYLFIGEGGDDGFPYTFFSKDSITKVTIDSAWQQNYAILELSMDRKTVRYMLPEYLLKEYSIESLDLTRIPTDSIQHEEFNQHILLCKDYTSSSIAMRKRAQSYLLKKDTASAINVYVQYRERIPKHRAWIDSSIALLTMPVKQLEIINLGKPINTNGSEWDPVPSPDGRSLFLSVRDRSGGEGKQDVFVAERIDTLEGSPWGVPKSIGKGVNSAQGEETIDNVSTDGNTILLSGTFPGSYGKFDIYTAERTSFGWDNLRQMPRPINSEFHDESGCLSSDGKVILFSSERPGGIGDITVPMNFRYADGTHGNMDLWACIKTDTGWSEPINLGPKINTPFAERSLFLHPDGRTLYFSSNGHPGLGGLDVYKSYRVYEDSWTEWTVPQNMGRSINTLDDDFSYKITVNGDTAYYAAQDAPGGLGEWDVYRVILPKDVRPQPIASISGKVISKNDGLPIPATIIWEDLSTGKTIGSSRVNPLDGSFFIVLPLGKKYGYYADAPGYFPSSSYIDLRKNKSPLTKKHIIALLKMPDEQKKEVTIELTNVFFTYRSSELLEESYPELQRLAEIIKLKKYNNILIAGHTDDRGSDAFNNNLSLKRAESVKKHLISLGIRSEYLKTQGFGKKQPRYTGKSDEERAGNRRVELTIIKE